MNKFAQFGLFQVRVHDIHVSRETVLSIKGFPTHLAIVDKMPCKVDRLHMLTDISLLFVGFPTRLAVEVSRVSVLFYILL